MLLPRTWRVFFGRFGRLLPIQEATIPHILAGRNVIVSSPTATGKTEAVVAPICENLGEKDRVVYIAPTRALVNDLDVRLSDPLRELGISSAVKTGDRPLRQAPQVLLTTPESFDSLLSRHPDMLAGLQWLVLDEIHLLDSTVRGDQLRVLCKRVPECVKFAALSATLSTPKETAARYFPDAEVVVQEGLREIDFTALPAEQLPTLRQQFLDRGIRKAIFFCNTRRETERLSGELQKFLPSDKVYVHHGSLSRDERESVEAAMRDGRMGFCAATMTLEFGIDIGDVDAIVLMGAPDSVSSLLQRLGRGNRRTGQCVAYALYRDKAERHEFLKQLDAARKGKIEKKEYKPRASVVVQQIFSMAFRGEIRREPLLTLCGESDLDAILAHLHKEGYLEKGRMAEKLADLAEKGFIHSNLDDTAVWEVVDMQTLQTIGDAPLGDGKTLLLGGRAWSVVKRDMKERRVYVKLSKSKVDAGAYAARRSLGAFFSLLPAQLRKPITLGASRKT